MRPFRRLSRPAAAFRRRHGRPPSGPRCRRGHRRPPQIFARSEAHVSHLVDGIHRLVALRHALTLLYLSSEINPEWPYLGNTSPNGGLYGRQACVQHKMQIRLIIDTSYELMVNCSYRVSESETVKAMQLHGRGSKTTLIILCVIGALLALVAVFTEYKPIAIAAVVGGVSGYFINIFGLIPFKAKRHYKQLRALRNEIIMELTDQGINFKSESGESRLKWSDIHKWKSSSEIYLLYITSNMFYMIPSRVFPNEESFVEILNKNVGPKNA